MAISSQLVWVQVSQWHITAMSNAMFTGATNSQIDLSVAVYHQLRNKFLTKLQEQQLSVVQ